MRLKQPIITTFKISAYVLLSAGLMTLNVAHAARAKRLFPRGCRNQGYAFDGQLLVLSPSTQHQTLYFIYNSSDHEDIVLEILHKNRYLPSHKNTIVPRDWGVFALNKDEFRFKCHSSDYNEQSYPTDCGLELKVCEYNNAKFAQHNQGTYWISKSTSRGKAIRNTIKNGILLRS